MSEESDIEFVRAKQRIGQVLRGKYRIDRVLGVGGMAAVYVATHRNQKQFAIKVLHPELSFRDEIRTRFLREGYAANSVKHPGAVAVLDDDVAEDGAAFLVMELLDGLTVEQLAEQSGGRLGMAYVLGIAHQLLDALSAAHANGIVHRDIKPANVFLSREGQVKVLDFGIARVRDAATSGAHATGTGLLLGTPAFMAPEQALGRTNEIDAQTDVWAVGATLFTLLSGSLVHEGETAPHHVVLAATTPARSLSAIVPEMPPAVASVVDRALAFRKPDRWPSCAAMRDAVRDASLALFGRLPLRETLMPMFDHRPDPLAQTRHADDGLVAPALGNPPGGPTPLPHATAPFLVPVGASGAAPARTPAVFASTAGAGGPWIPPHANPGFGAGFGQTTSHPVSNDAPISLPAGVPRSRPMVLGIVAVVGVLLVVGGAAVGVRSMTARSDSMDGAPAGEAATIPAPVPSQAPFAASSAVPPLEPLSRVHSLAAAASAPIPPVASSSSEPGVAGADKPVAGGPAASSRARRTPADTASPAGATPAATPACHVVSFFDADGNKHFSQECH